MAGMRRRRTIHSQASPPLGEIVIRPAYGDDQEDLCRLAALDSQEGIPRQPLVLIERDGRLAAAISRADGSVIADPFQRTAELVALLRSVSAPGL